MRTTINLYTMRDHLAAYEFATPTFVAESVAAFEQELNANGRGPLRGHRTDVTPARLLRELPDLLNGALGAGPQLSAFRKVQHLRANPPGPWRAATLQILTDFAQLLDDKLERNRAARIAQSSVIEATKGVKEWLAAEAPNV